MTKFTACSLFLAISLPGFAAAEPLVLHCIYTEAAFNAPYMSQPETRACPQGRCVYELRFDTEGAGGSVNGVEGYRLTVEEQRYLLQREVRNPIVGGTDSASFTVDRGTLSYSSIKTTSPGVVLETTGQCQPIQ